MRYPRIACLCFLGAALLLGVPMSGQDYALPADLDPLYQHLPFALQKPEMPRIPDCELLLTDYGAVADGVSDCSDAFAAALKELERIGGGRLRLSPGVYVSGPIVLKDRMELRLDRGAVLLFSPEKARFIKNGKAVPCISASKRSDIAITGEGIIDGNGSWWRPVKRSKVSDVEWKDYRRLGGTVTADGSLWYPYDLQHFDNITTDPRSEEKLRTHLIRLSDCHRVLVAGVTIQNAPKFHLVPQRCEDVILRDLTLRCPWNAQNGDGIDLMNSRRVLVTRCSVDVGDDGICVKAGAGADGVRYGPCSDLLICDNVVFRAHGGFVIGSEFSGGVRNVLVERNTFSGTDTGLRFKSAAERGGKTEQLWIRDIRMLQIRGEAIVFETDYADRPAGYEDREAARTEHYLPEFCDIFICGVICRDCRVAVKAGGNLSSVHDIRIENSHFFYSDTPLALADPAMIRFREVFFHSYE